MKGVKTTDYSEPKACRPIALLLDPLLGTTIQPSTTHSYGKGPKGEKRYIHKALGNMGIWRMSDEDSSTHRHYDRWNEI